MLEPLDGSLFGDDQPCFGCAVNHPIGFHLKFQRDGDDAVVTRFTPGTQYQGPPGIMHGGLVFTLADEAAAWAVLAKLETFGFTTSIEGKFRRPVRIGHEAEVRATVTKASHRVVRLQCEVKQQGEVCFEAQLVFALLDRGAAEKLLGGPVPEGWARFAAAR